MLYGTLRVFMRYFGSNWRVLWEYFGVTQTLLPVSVTVIGLAARQGPGQRWKV